MTKPPRTRSKEVAQKIVGKPFGQIPNLGSIDEIHDTSLPSAYIEFLKGQKAQKKEKSVLKEKISVNIDNINQLEADYVPEYLTQSRE